MRSMAPTRRRRLPALAYPARTDALASYASTADLERRAGATARPQAPPVSLSSLFHNKDLTRRPQTINQWPYPANKGRPNRAYSALERAAALAADALARRSPGRLFPSADRPMQPPPAPLPTCAPSR